MSYAKKYPSDRDLKTPLPQASNWRFYFDNKYPNVPDSKDVAADPRKTKGSLGKKC